MAVPSVTASEDPFVEAAVARRRDYWGYSTQTVAAVAG
jgi:hypothetical protein